MEYTIFEIYETVITEAHINFMNNHFRHEHTKWPTYKKWFFRNNPDAPEEDYYSWMIHHMCKNWEDDIFWMDDEQFKYHWPSHYIFIMDIYSEEESNHSGPSSD